MGMKAPEREEPDQPEEIPDGNYWFGTKALRNDWKAANSMFSLLPESHEDGEHRTNDFVTSATSRPRLDGMMERMNVEDDDEDEPRDDLELFLESVLGKDGILYYPSFKQQKMDMNALEMCDDNDLKSLGIELGSRKKIMNALQKRARSPDNGEITLF